MACGIKGHWRPPFFVPRPATALTESLANNHAFLDGNKRGAFDAAHTCLLGNGFTLQTEPLATYTSITDSMAHGKFRFPVMLEWSNAHLKPLE